MMHSVILLLTIICALFRPVINTEKNYKNLTSLKIFNGIHEISNCNVTYLYNKNPESEYSKIGKVWYFSSETDYSTLIERYLILSFHYIFLFDDVKLFIHFLTLDTKQIKVNGIIVSNTSDFTSPSIQENILSSNHSIFMYENSSIKALEIYDIRIEDNNYFINLYYSLIIYQIPLNYVKWVSLIILVISLMLPVWWNIKLKYTPEDSLLLLQKVIVFIPYLNALLCGLITFQMFSKRENKTGSTSNSNIYIETVLVTIRAIFRTLLWFFIMLVASGWQLVVKSLSRDEIKSYIKIYVFIYIIVCLDQVVDAFSGTIFKIFYPSELKNIGFYLLMVIGVFQKGLRTVKFLKSKLIYAVFLAQEHVPSLRLKLKMMYFHIGGVIAYFCLYCIVMVIQKVVFTEYNVQEFILVNYHILDILLVIFYMVVYHPRVLPDSFNVEYGNEEIEVFGNIYNAKIPNIEKITKEDEVIALSQSEIHDLTQDNNEEDKPRPIVVMNPVFLLQNDVNKKTINLVIDRLSVGYIS